MTVTAKIGYMDGDGSSDWIEYLENLLRETKEDLQTKSREITKYENLIEVCKYSVRILTDKIALIEKQISQEKTK